MFSRFLFLVMIVVPGIAAEAQPDTGKVEIMWGEDLYLETKNVIPLIVGYDSTGYYALVDDYNWAVEHYDRNLGNSKREYLDMNAGLRTRELEALVHFH